MYLSSQRHDAVPPGDNLTRYIPRDSESSDAQEISHYERRQERSVKGQGGVGRGREGWWGERKGWEGREGRGQPPPQNSGSRTAPGLTHILNYSDNMNYLLLGLRLIISYFQQNSSATWKGRNRVSLQGTIIERRVTAFRYFNLSSPLCCCTY